LTLLAAMVLNLSNPVQAAPGDVDLSFVGSLTNYPVVDAVSLLPDGKMLVGGNFALADGWPKYRIARLNRDGSLDNTFEAGFIDSAIDCMALDPDGHVLIGGHFQHINGTNRNFLARLNSAGNLDAVFNPARALNGDVYAIGLQTNGAVVIGGIFSTVGQSNIAGIARLTPAGQLDSTFNVGAGTFGTVYALMLQTDGRIVVAGNFSSLHGSPVHYIARLNSDGTLDSTFDAPITLGSPADGIYSVVLQPDGKIVIGGQFVTAGPGTARTNLARLNNDGTVDANFSAGASPNGRVYAVALQADGRVVVSGYFGMIGNSQHIGLARLNSDGTVDPDFKSFFAWWGTIEEYPNVLACQPDNRLIIGGSFDTVSGSPHNGIVRLLGDPAPKLNSITRTDTGGMIVSGQASTNSHLRLDASADLLSWWPLVEFTNTAGWFTFEDAAPTNTHQFYRAAWLP